MLLIYIKSIKVYTKNEKGQKIINLAAHAHHIKLLLVIVKQILGLSIDVELCLYLIFESLPSLVSE